jgi:hypothetical protein
MHGRAFVASRAFRALFLCTIVAGSASAQNANDKAAAEALFDQGKAFMAAGNYAAACPKFSESLHLDEGVGTSLWLAECFERSGKIASAWAQFREAAATAVKLGDPRERVAREHAAALEPKLSKIVIVVPKDVVVPGLKVARDGEAVDSPLWGTPVPIDAGDHTIVVTAKGKKKFTTVAHVLPTASTQTVAVPVLEDNPEALAEEATPVSPPPATGPDVVSSPTRTERDPNFRIAGITVAAIGVAGLVIGTVFGVDAMTQLNDSNSTGGCTSGTTACRTQAGVNERSAAQTAATASTVGFALGGAAVVGGALMYFLAPRVNRSSSAATLVPMVDPRGGGLGLVGTF